MADTKTKAAHKVTPDNFSDSYYRDGFNRIVKKDGTPVSAAEHADITEQLAQYDTHSEPITTAPRGTQDFGNEAKATTTPAPANKTTTPGPNPFYNVPDPHAPTVTPTAGIINTTSSMSGSPEHTKTDENGQPVDPKAGQPNHDVV